MNKNDKKALIDTLVANDAIMLSEDKLNEMCDEALLNFGKLIEPDKAGNKAEAQKAEKIEVINKLVDEKITTLTKENLEMLELPVLKQLVKTAKKEPGLSKESVLKVLGITEETLNAVISRTTQSVQNDEASKTAVIKELVDSKALGLSEDQLKELPIPVLNEFKMFSSPMNFAMRTQQREDQSIPEMPPILNKKPKKEDT